VYVRTVLVLEGLHPLPCSSISESSSCGAGQEKRACAGKCAGRVRGSRPEHAHLVRRLSYLSCCAWLNPSWGGLSGAGLNPPNTTARTT